jgi:hypothetical protein
MVGAITAIGLPEMALRTSFGLHRINQYLLSKQHLTRDTQTDDVKQIAADICGLHATSGTTPYLSVFARSKAFKKTDLDHCLYKQHTLGKIRCVRKTIYIHPLEMLPVVYSATASMVQKASNRFMEGRGITPVQLERISAQILTLLNKQEMTAAEIKSILEPGLDLSSVLYYMCDLGLLVRGKPVRSWRDKNHTYARFKDTFPGVILDGLSEEQAVKELVWAYLCAFGPVTLEDIVWWLGIGKSKVQAALAALDRSTNQTSTQPIWGGVGGEKEVRRIQIKDSPGDFLCTLSDLERLQDFKPPQTQTVNLLPWLDPYMMGYKLRHRYLDERDCSYVFDRSGNATSILLLDGRVVGIWDYEDADPPIVKVFYLNEVNNDCKKEIAAQALETGRFISGQDIQVRSCKRMTPLTKRTAGSVMTPLKES